MNILTPVGRLVSGSLYKASTTDNTGQIRVVKTGPNAGQPRPEYYFALAIPKGAEQHWSQTPWGKIIYDVGAAGFPQGQYNAPTFAWKVVDGDSQVPNKEGKKPADREGYKGHWVLSFKSGYAPKIYNRDGTQQIVEPDAVKLGYYIQVHGTVESNNSQQSPGVYLNHGMVALSAYGPEIVVGPDASAVGFGGGALPAGASSTPPAGSFNPAPAAATPAGLPPLPGGASAIPQMPAVAAPAAVPVVPNPAFLAGPAASLPMPAIPAVPAAKQLTAKAQGHTYDALVAAGWTDETLRANGLML